MIIDYKVLQLDVNDIPEIFTLSSKIIKEDFPIYSPKVARIYADDYFSEKYLEKILKNETNCILGIKNKGKIIGIVILKGEYGGVLYMDLLAVEKKHRKHGVGLRLLQETESWALENKYHYLWLYTESEEDIEFYKNKGFQYLGVHKGSWFGADEHMLSKQLRNQPFPEVFKNYSKYF